jgi:hypothetical protein
MEERNRKVRPYLLKHKPTLRTPSKDFIIASYAIDSRLASNRPPTTTIELQKLRPDACGFFVQALFAPGDCFEVTSEVFEKYVGDLSAISGIAPEFDGLGYRYVEGYAIAIDFAVRLNVKLESMR